MDDLSDLSDSDFPTLSQLIDADVFKRQVESSPLPSFPTVTTSTTKSRGKGGLNPSSDKPNPPRSPLNTSLSHPSVNYIEHSVKDSPSKPSVEHKIRKERSERSPKNDTFSDSKDSCEASSPCINFNSGLKPPSTVSPIVTTTAQPLQPAGKRTARRRSGHCNAADLSPFDTPTSSSGLGYVSRGSPKQKTPLEDKSRKVLSALHSKVSSPAVSQEVISLLSEDEEEEEDEVNGSDEERDAVERFVMGEADVDVIRSTETATSESTGSPRPKRTKEAQKTLAKSRTKLSRRFEETDESDVSSYSPPASPSSKRSDSLPSSAGSIDSPAIVVDDWGFQDTDDGYLISNEDEGVLRWSPPPKRLSPIQDVLHGSLGSPSTSATPPHVARPRAKPRSKSAGTGSEPSTAGSGQTVMKINSKHWKARRETLAVDLIDELDRKVFKQAIRPSLSREPEMNELKDTSGLGGVAWTGKLRTTAGMSRWCRREGPGGKGDVRHVCTVELSTKILDTEEKVLSTTAHELCHLATWIFDGKNTKPHGKEFKAWAQKVMNYRPDILITTKHTFEIVHKYKWICDGCSASYGRDTKSIDPSKQCCGKCKGRLIPQFKSQNQAPAQAPGPDGSDGLVSGSGSTTPGKPNAYREFVRENYKTMASPGMSAPQVMKLVAEKWRAQRSTVPPSPSPTPLTSAAAKGNRVGREEEDLSGVLRGLSIREGKAL